MRKGKILYKNQPAGTIWEDEEGFWFQYEERYLQQPNAKSVSLTLPLSSDAFFSKTLFSFFDGLIPEGWLLDIAVTNWKLNSRDRFGLLLTLCADCIGCVSVEAIDL